MIKYIARIAVAAALLATGSSASAATIYLCRSGILTVTQVVSHVREDGTVITTSSTTTATCGGGDWEYIEGLVIAPGTGVVFEETGPRGQGSFRALSLRSPVVVSILGAWRRMSTSAGRRNIRTVNLSAEAARATLARSEGLRQLRITIPLQFLVR